MTQNRTKDKAYINDFQTPPDVCDYMVSLLPAGVKNLLEPTPGIGNLVRAAEDRGYNVIGPTNYWILDKTLRFEAIIGNLPFSSRTFWGCPKELEGTGMIVSYQQLTVLMGMSDNLILLMPWFTISDSDVRLRNLKRFGLISVTALPRKTFQYSRIQTVILQLQKGYTGPSEFKVYELLNL